jgi:nucleoside-diphosphate-sugar epimerase
MHLASADGFQPEREGIKHALQAARNNGLKRVGYLSSMLMDYQGQDGFDWWVYRIKQEAVVQIQNSGLPYYIFKPSTFYENVPHRFRQGNRVLVAGDSSPMWWNSASYLGKVLARALTRDTTGSKTYYVQGPQPLTSLQGSEVFVKNYGQEPLELVPVPFGQFEKMKDENPFMNYLYHITMAMNNYREGFRAQETWDELGRPEMTLAEYAKQFKS